MASTYTPSSGVAIIDEAGEVCEDGQIPTTEAGFMRHFGRREPMVICIEAGGVSAWAQRVLTSLGRQVVVANPLRVRLIAEATLKNDAVDAKTLARLVRADPRLLSPIVHRSETTQRPRGVLRVRGVLVSSRTASSNACATSSTTSTRRRPRNPGPTRRAQPLPLFYSKDRT